MAIAALTVVGATSVALLVLGRRYTQRYVAQTGTLPPMTWMFRRTDNPELEAPRRLALVLLPIDIVAAVLYLTRSG
jgi:hypothetical protein